MALSEGPDANLSIEDQLFLQDMSVIVSEVTGASRRSAIAMFNNMLVKFKDQFFTGGATAKTYHELSEDEWVAHGRKWIRHVRRFQLYGWWDKLEHLLGIPFWCEKRSVKPLRNFGSESLCWASRVVHQSTSRDWEEIREGL